MARRRSKKRWMKGAVKKPGALRKQLGAKKGKKIPVAQLIANAGKPGKLGSRARLALVFRGYRKVKGRWCKK